VDALFYGVDGSLSLAPNAPVGLEAQGGIVRAEDRDIGSHLIGTPTDNLTLSLIGRPPPLGPVRSITIRATTDLVATQSRVDPANDFAPPPPGYALFGGALEAEIGRRHTVRAGLEARNIMNTAYREYTSLIRYYSDNPGRDFRVRLGMEF
jgi:iron complex outermembrane receptor protein